MVGPEELAQMDSIIIIIIAIDNILYRLTLSSKKIFYSGIQLQ